MKVIWSSDNGFEDFITGNRDDKLQYLKDAGWEGDEISDDELDSAVYKDAEFWIADAAVDFADNIRPALEQQSKDGIVIVCSDWGEFPDACYAEDLIDDMFGSADLVELVEADNGDLEAVMHISNGQPVTYKLYAVPEDVDELTDFVANCLPELMADMDDDMQPEDAIEEIATNLTPEDISNYCTIEGIKKNCQPFKATGINESLDEAKSSDPQGLQAELDEIKPLASDYGFEYFTSMPFTNYDNDPTSIEYQYPNFFKVCKSFFKEMGIADDINDNDELDMLWDTNIDDHDWNTIMTVCDKLISNKDHSQQIEKIYKNDFNDTLDDEKILADRERQAELDSEFGESLNEASNDIVTVEIDVADDDIPLDERGAMKYLRNIFGRSGFEFEVVQLTGPGGGWPVVRLTGQRDQLKDWIAHNYFGDEFEDEELEDEFNALVVESLKESKIVKTKEEAEASGREYDGPFVDNEGNSYYRVDEARIKYIDDDGEEQTLSGEYSKKEAETMVKHFSKPDSRTGKSTKAWVEEDLDDDTFDKVSEIISDNTFGDISDEEMHKRLLDLLGSEEAVNSAIAEYDELLVDDPLIGETLNEEKGDGKNLVGKRVYISKLDEISPEDFGFNRNDEEDLKSYDEILDHNGCKGTIIACDVDAGTDNPLDGYWDVQCDDGFMLDSISGYHLELADDESLNEESDDAEITEWPWGDPNLGK